MRAKGQSNLIVPAVGFALVVAMGFFSFVIIDQAVSKSIQSTSSSYRLYEGAVYSYEHVSDGENFRLSDSEIQEITGNRCRHPFYSDVRLFFPSRSLEEPCVGVNRRHAVYSFLNDGEIKLIYGSRGGG